jgi:hypothetical protein
MKSAWLHAFAMFLLAPGLASAQTAPGDTANPVRDGVPSIPRFTVESPSALRPDGLARSPLSFTTKRKSFPAFAANRSMKSAPKHGNCLHIHAYVFDNDDPPKLTSQKTCVDASLSEVLQVEDAQPKKAITKGK